MTVNRVIALAKAHGFTWANADAEAILEHPDGHVLMVSEWNWAARWADGTFGECKAGAFASYYDMEPEALGCKSLETSMSNRNIAAVYRTCELCGCRYSISKPLIVDRSDCRDMNCRCHRPGRSRRDQ